MGLADPQRMDVSNLESLPPKDVNKIHAPLVSSVIETRSFLVRRTQKLQNEPGQLTDSHPLNGLLSDRCPDPHSTLKQVV